MSFTSSSFPFSTDNTVDSISSDSTKPKTNKSWILRKLYDSVIGPFQDTPITEQLNLKHNNNDTNDTVNDSYNNDLNSDVDYETEYNTKMNKSNQNSFNRVFNWFRSYNNNSNNKDNNNNNNSNTYGYSNATAEPIDNNTFIRSRRNSSLFPNGFDYEDTDNVEIQDTLRSIEDNYNRWDYMNRQEAHRAKENSDAYYNPPDIRNIATTTSTYILPLSKDEYDSIQLIDELNNNNNILVKLIQDFDNLSDNINIKNLTTENSRLIKDLNNLKKDYKNEIKNSEKLSHDYYKLVVKYRELKKNFDSLKNKSESITRNPEKNEANGKDEENKEGDKNTNDLKLENEELKRQMAILTFKIKDNENKNQKADEKYKLLENQYNELNKNYILKVNEVSIINEKLATVLSKEDTKKDYINELESKLSNYESEEKRKLYERLTFPMHDNDGTTNKTRIKSFSGISNSIPLSRHNSNRPHSISSLRSISSSSSSYEEKPLKLKRQSSVSSVSADDFHRASKNITEDSESSNVKGSRYNTPKTEFTDNDNNIGVAGNLITDDDTLEFLRSRYQDKKLKYFSTQVPPSRVSQPEIKMQF
ncbi:hypothetical protein B5S33_g1142 [[Candida] boidinii]|nr:hypothetical protein B5S30_g443 [[Candida] boidinii]OWB82516.1 hypothetical protein B5S33_g1142 [[Candida] boidinii]